MSNAAPAANVNKKTLLPVAKRADTLGRGAIELAITNTRWIVAAEDPTLCDRVRNAIGPRPGITIEHAKSGVTVRRQLKKLAASGESVAFLVTDAEAADFEKTAKLLAQTFPEAALIAVSESESFEAAVTAMRHDAADVIPTSASNDEWSRRLRLAAGRRWLQVRTDRRLSRLKLAVRRLNTARRTVGQKVDLLCNDFLHAYGELAERVEQTRLDSTLRTLLDGAADLEQMLCHLMDWLLKHVGRCNIAVFLTNDEGESELGAYMKHTVACEEGLLAWLDHRILPRAAGAGPKLWNARPEQFAVTLDPTDPQQAAMLDQCLLAGSCEYLAESLGTIVLFRDEAQPFGDHEEDLLRRASAVFAEALTALVRRDGELDDADDELNELDDEADVDLLTTEDVDGDDTDWWQRGDNAPF